MKTVVLTCEIVKKWREHLIKEEKSRCTLTKYVADVTEFMVFASGKGITKELALAYKQHLIGHGYAPRSVNSKIASLNNLFTYLNLEKCKLKSLRLQRQIYTSEEKELTKNEYLRLIEAAKKNPRLCLIIKTICGTGIRVSELQYFTVEAVRRGTVTVSCKNKTRNILVPGKLRRLLLDYTSRSGITEGIIFRTRNGKPISRSNIWTDMKKLCEAAQVNPAKVFPHNLRKLFARTFYGIEKDIAKLADILGHSSVETTRIYIMTTGEEHRKKIERLGLVV